MNIQDIESSGNDPRPVIAISAGDPAGIGAEVLAKTLAGGALIGLCRPLIVGARWALDAGAEAAGVGLPDAAFRRCRCAAPGRISLRRKSPRRAARRRCVRLKRPPRITARGDAAAMVTCPINKEAVHAAGFVDDIGHQEILARLTGSKWTATMLMTPGLRVVHLSTHKSLIEAARFVTHANDRRKAAAHARHARALGHGQSTHRGCGVESARRRRRAAGPRGNRRDRARGRAGSSGRHRRVSGPIPADSVFNRAIAGEFDLVLAMYHDQGHIAIKVHNFAQSVTATLGIPFIRTSVDHGTAFDIAGRGVADPTSLLAAIRAAVTLAQGRLGRDGF